MLGEGAKRCRAGNFTPGVWVVGWCNWEDTSIPLTDEMLVKFATRSPLKCWRHGCPMYATADHVL